MPVRQAPYDTRRIVLEGSYHALQRLFEDKKGPSLFLMVQLHPYTNDKFYMVHPTRYLSGALFAVITLECNLRQPHITIMYLQRHQLFYWLPFKG